MAKPTPGPWKYSNRSIIGADGELVAELTVDVTIPEAEMKANGKLIVDAAKMRQALKRIADAADDVSGGARFVQIAKEALKD